MMIKKMGSSIIRWDLDVFHFARRLICEQRDVMIKSRGESCYHSALRDGMSEEEAGKKCYGYHIDRVRILSILSCERGMLIGCGVAW